MNIDSSSHIYAKQQLCDRMYTITINLYDGNGGVAGIARSGNLQVDF